MLTCSTWKQRVGAPWSRPVRVRATPRCSPFLPGLEEPEAIPWRLLRRSCQVQAQMGDQLRAWPCMGLPSFLPTLPSPSVLPLGMEWAWRPPLPLRDHRLQQNTLGCLFYWMQVHIPNTQWGQTIPKCWSLEPKKPHALKIPNSLKLSAKAFYEKGKWGAWLVVATFLVSEPFFLMSGHDIPVNLQQNKLFSFMIRKSKVPKLSLHPLRSRLWPRGEGKLLQESWWNMKAAWVRCVLSLCTSVYSWPSLTPAHKPSALNHPWVPRVHPGPRGWRRSIPILNPSQMTQAPLCVPWGLGAPGSEGNYWMGAQQAGRRSHGGCAPWDPGRQAPGEGGQVKESDTTDRLSLSLAITWMFFLWAIRLLRS